MSQSRHAKVSQRFSLLAAGITLVLGIAVLAGWATRCEPLKRIHSSFVAMNPMTAACFIALGVALLLEREPPSLLRRRWARGLAVTAALVGAIRLATYILHTDLPIDRLLFYAQTRFDPAAHSASRMAPNTALGDLLMGLAIALIDARIHRWRPGQYLALLALLVSLTAILGYAYSAKPLYGVGPFIPMALHTAAGFFFLSLSQLCARPTRGVMSVIVSETDAGIIARRLLPVAILMPACLGFIWLFGWERRWYEVPLGIAVGVVVGIGLLMALVSWNAAIVYRADARRRLTQNLLEVQNQMLEETARSERQAHQDLKHAQAGLVQTEKLASLGQMVAGIAHEINNPLAFVSNNMTVLQRDLASIKQILDLYRQADPAITTTQPQLVEQIRQLAQRIDLDYTAANLQEVLSRSGEGLNRIHQIVKDLRNFARLDEAECHQVDLNEGVESTVNIIRGRARRKQVEIIVDAGDLPKLECQPAKINQVIMNLLANAIDAAPEGGWVKTHTQREGEGILLEVTDNGPGVPQEIRGRIFDPFFTTKPPGEGTGLGLSIAYGIVRDHGGRIELIPDTGGHFAVFLPLHRSPTPGVQAPS